MIITQRLIVLPFIMSLMPMAEIRQRIDAQYCEETERRLSDECLADVWGGKEAVRRKRESYRRLHDDHERRVSSGFMSKEMSLNRFLDEMVKMNTPPGLKGAVRGSTFNQIVKEAIRDVMLPEDRFEVQFEARPHRGAAAGKMNEIPDWYIRDRETERTMIGYNQVDLWGGGQQRNRGDKYLLQPCDPDHSTTRVVCVIARRPEAIDENSYVYKIFANGFQQDRLCYIKDLKRIILSFFHQEGKTIGLHRQSTDKFYTKPGAVSECIRLWRQHVLVDAQSDCVMEPSAGAGAFVAPLVEVCDNRLFTDLHPAHAAVERADFLTFRPDDWAVLRVPGKVHVVGNPPFGRQGCLAHAFLKKAMTFASTVSFILPRSFKKDSQQDRVDRHFHLVASMDLPEDSFVIESVDHRVPCVFQIWERRDTLRAKAIGLTATFFEFVKKEDPHDVAFRRVGGNAGSVYKETADKSPSSHYFLRFTNGQSLDENYRRMCSLVFLHGNTTGPRSISQQELLRALDCVGDA
ncbi:hypothetical protein EBZ80_18505 [bacterium]|nr:hypothetical protein [bacterium]